MSRNLTPILIIMAAILAAALFIKGGEVITAYQVATTNQSASIMNITNQAPTVENLKCYDYNDHQISTAAPLALKGGTTSQIVCNATANDYNGGETINSTTPTGRAYKEAVGPSCSADSTNCYVNSSCAWLGVKNKTAQYVECRYFIYYHADPTGEIGDWYGNITVNDGALYGSEKWGFDVGDLLALGVAGTLPFGTANPGDKLAVNKTHAVTNYGNVQIDLQLNGSNPGMDCTSATDIPTGNIKYNCTNSQGAVFDGIGTPLTTTASSANCTDFDLDESSSTSFPPALSSKDTYWGVEIPLGVSGSCQGTIWFTAIYSVPPGS
ncbi:MAG: hypothetical protein QXD77_00505 [Candidatus Aenigmatarchaeota archaeon]